MSKKIKSASELLKNIKEITNKNVTPKIYLVKRKYNKSDFSLFDFQIKTASHKELIKGYQDSIKQTLEGKVINNFDLSLTEENSIEAIKKSQVKQFELIENKLNNISKIENIKSDKFKPYQIWCIMVVYRLKSGKQMILFRKYKNGKSYKQKKMFNIVGDELTKIDKKIVAFDEDIDGILIDDYFYIINRFNFSNIFAFNDMYKKLIEDNTGKIKSYNLIEKPDFFIDTCKNNGNYIRRLCKSLIAEGFERLDDNFDKVKDVRDKWKLNIIIKDGKLIHNNNKDNVKEILDLLLDHYVNSALTNQQYIAKALEKYTTEGK
jgi:hypothetical protein